MLDPCNSCPDERRKGHVQYSNVRRLTLLHIGPLHLLMITYLKLFFQLVNDFKNYHEENTALTIEKDVLQMIKVTPETIITMKYTSFIFDFYCFYHRLQTPSKESPSLHGRKSNLNPKLYCRSILRLPHRLKISIFFNLCLHWVSVVHGFYC